ncbi:NAD(P)/FAD-dependent oxidoreductase [Ktedonosporobacter rubrisoli]|uniref:NAD(P)/FAD-dependent oxidoreductase n=1 Tax=Ktedonosporobacter rubrisoli TaxID=2509675 RepID=A0A4P6JLU1_KTERU|nr:NAD(P)/FAD-dependent oxidoreductase [Ktedonosporobacter rubrisoli]QBD76198.1 NAD(P)/FAD-dependent oxidoreductase [Ktedonosporobacter rubrisoli]
MSQTNYDYDLTILGGGSGGLTAARVAASLGARVLLIDKERLGGDCLYTGCVPSKSLIHVAQIVHQANNAARLGLTTHGIDVDMAHINTYIQGVIKRVYEAEHIYTDDVTVKFGSVSFQSPTALLLDSERITSRSTIIVTGSHPVIPQIAGLADLGYLTNEDVFQLTRLPASLLIVGGGPIGVELGQALARLGVRITIIQGPERILPREDPAVSAAITDVLESEGVTVVTKARAQNVERSGAKKRLIVKRGDQFIAFEADELLLAVGRQPNVDGLGLDKLGIACTAQGIQVNSYLQTTRKNIFALGDVIGGYLFTHVAAYQAGVAVRNALLPVSKKKVDYRVLPWCTFTDPEAARVGLTYEEAQQQHRQVRAVTLPWADIDRAQTEGATTGFIQLVLAGKKEEIVGAHMVGTHAGELLGEIALAMQHHLTISDMLATIHPYPTLTTGLQQAVFEAQLSGRQGHTNRRIVSTMLRLLK